jgi:hypothetical protein
MPQILDEPAAAPQPAPNQQAKHTAIRAVFLAFLTSATSTDLIKD